MIDWIRFKLEGRSSKWGALRKNMIADKMCAACMKPDNLELHHITPFRLRPDLELNPINLIVLCKHCHFTLGHFNNWDRYNPDIVGDAQIYRLKLLGVCRRIV